MYHKNTSDENEDGDYGSPFYIFLKEQAKCRYNMGQLNGPSQRHTHRSKADLIQVEVSKVVNAIIEHAEDTMSQKYYRYRESKEECIVEYFHGWDF